MENFINRDGAKSPQHRQGDESAQLSQNSLPSSTQPGGIHSRLPLAVHGTPKDPQELLNFLGQLSKVTLIQTLLLPLKQDSLIGQARRTHVLPGAKANDDASIPSIADWGPEYNTRQIAQMGGVSKQTITARVHNLVARGWLEERLDKMGKWSFDAQEANIILRNPHNRGPLKKRPT